MWYTYMLLCIDRTIYTGVTNDLSARLDKHRTGRGAKYTRSRGADKIIYSERHRSKSIAMKREAAIKKLKRAEKLLLTKTNEL